MEENNSVSKYSYMKAVRFNLEEDFGRLLEIDEENQEIERRNTEEIIDKFCDVGYGIFKELGEFELLS